MTDAKPVATPMQSGLQLSKTDGVQCLTRPLS
jgi:hypothetical protein